MPSVPNPCTPDANLHEGGTPVTEPNTDAILALAADRGIVSAKDLAEAGLPRHYLSRKKDY